jgi:hypothetical protein
MKTLLTPQLAARLALLTCLPVVLASIGCSTPRHTRATVAPTYSYVHDLEAREEVEFWASLDAPATETAGRFALADREVR